MVMELIVMEEEKPISISMMEEEEYSEYSVESSEEEEEEEEDSDYDMDKSKNEPEEEDESDEEVICDRVEVDRGINYVLMDVGTVTRPQIAKKTYFRRKKCYPYRHELYHYKFPLSTFAKFALDRYNHIKGTKYEYVGLVKAYSRPVGAVFYFIIRFKACLPDQDHGIYFQANMYQKILDRKTGVADVRVEFVYPLPTPVMPVNLLAKEVSAVLLS
ncbi:hypothetical protein POM88_005485 [Heracleum sosnowskyi]|uniref:Uncharacterized protein n=1 Tax=Heracleum sosnowskyi TaxID=360622 RepID=A0AAD8J456_9APIA|nr:hypothetical protein POM88_005485 [Heracleum sosnowskyi]